MKRLAVTTPKPTSSASFRLARTPKRTIWKPQTPVSIQYRSFAVETTRDKSDVFSKTKITSSSSKPMKEPPQNDNKEVPKQEEKTSVVKGRIPNSK